VHEPTASKGWSFLLAKLYQVRKKNMSTLNDARLPSLRDKLLAQEAIAKAEVVVEEKEKERVVVATEQELAERDAEHSDTESDTSGESESTKTVVEVACETLPALSVA